MEKQFVRLFPVVDKPLVVIVANDGVCMEIALDTARSVAGVERTEVAESAGHPPRMAPSGDNVPQRDQGPFKYHIIMHVDTDHTALTSQLKTHIQQALDAADCAATVVIEN